MTCKNCGRENPDTSKFCRGCGIKIEIPAPPAPTFTAHEGLQQPVCPTCGKAIKPESKFCTGCGAVLTLIFNPDMTDKSDTAPVWAQTDAANPILAPIVELFSNKRKLWIPICCILVVATGTSVFLSTRQKDVGEPVPTPSAAASSVPAPVSSVSSASASSEISSESADVSSNAASSQSNGLYRVRKSWSDDKTQIGAFADIENAKKHADDNAEEGYKVFDPEGKLVYEPTASGDSSVAAALTGDSGGYSTSLPNITIPKSQSDYYKSELMKNPLNDNIYKELDSFCESIGNRVGRVAIAEMRYKMNLIDSWMRQVIREQNDITFQNETDLFMRVRNIAEDIPSVYPTSSAELKAEAGETIHYRLSEYIDYDYYRTLSDRSTPFPGMSKSQLGLIKKDVLEYTKNLNIPSGAPRIVQKGDLIDARLVKLNSDGIYGVLLSKYDDSESNLCVNIRIYYYDRNCEARCIGLFTGGPTDTEFKIWHGPDETFYIYNGGNVTYYFNEFDYQSTGYTENIQELVEPFTTVAKNNENGEIEAFTDAKQGLEKTLRELDSMIASANLN